MKTRTQHQEISHIVQDWLTQGLLTPMQGLERVHLLKQEGQGALADVMQAAIQDWHDAERERIRAAMARGL